MNNTDNNLEAFANPNKRFLHGYMNVNNEFQQMQNDLSEAQRQNVQTIMSPTGGQVGQRSFSDKPQECYIWEMRTRSPNLTPASTVLNSPDLNTDVQYCMQQQQRQHMQIHVGRSPGSQFEQTDLLPQGLASPGSPTDVGKADGQCLRDGEIVVFDDIGSNWVNTASNYTTNGIPSSPYQNTEDILKVTKMIGQLPIAEYEGSPRRFGSQSTASKSSKISGTSSTTNGSCPKKPPGFPQRISPKHSASIPQNQESLRKQLQTHCSTLASTQNNDNKSIGNLIDIEDDSCEKNQMKVKTPTFDYLYECSETRKVLEEFFKGNIEDEKRFAEFTESGDDTAVCETLKDFESDNQNAIVGQRLARIPNEELCLVHRSPKKQSQQQPAEISFSEQNEIELYIDSNSRSSGDLADTELEANLRRHSRNFTLSPETTDYDSNCGDLDSLSNDINCQTDYSKLYTSMPVLEDGLSSGHASDTENNGAVASEKSENKENHHIDLEKDDFNEIPEQNTCDGCQDFSKNVVSNLLVLENDAANPPGNTSKQQYYNELMTDSGCCNSSTRNNSNEFSSESHYDAVYATIPSTTKRSPPKEATHIISQQTKNKQREATDIIEAMKEIRSALQRAKTQPEKLKFCDEVLPPDPDSPVWVPRNKTTSLKSNCSLTNNNHLTIIGGVAKENRIGLSPEEEEQDTDLETDRLLGHQRHDDQDIFDDQTIWPKTSRIGLCESNESSQSLGELKLHGTSVHTNHKPQTFSSATIRQGIGTSLTPSSPDDCQLGGNCDVSLTSPEDLQYSKSPTGSLKSLKDSTNSDKKAKARNKEGFLEPAVLIEGVLFRARYLGSTQLVCEGQPTKSTRMMQAEEAVSRIKAPEGESQPSTEVDLFISTEKIMVLNTDLKEIMMDHALRTISYIADIGDLVVLMARRRFVPSPDLSNSDNDNNQSKEIKENSSSGGGGGSNKHNRTPKMICHVFESDEAQFIAQSIGQAFQVAYMEFLKANGIENENLAKEMDYQEVLNSQEIFGDELEIFAKKELQKEVVVPKAKGEILGVVIVESGWGSMLPTVVIANLMSGGAAARCGQLNIGDQLIAINGLSLVGLPLSTCQNYIRNAKNQTAVKFTVVPCPPVVEVKIIRPKALFQLGFSVQNGVICSLLRGGIAERGGVRVGHRIIEINNQSVVAVPHDTIVKLLSSSVGEILMKTMPTSMFRLLTGQETPIYI